MCLPFNSFNKNSHRTSLRIKKRSKNTNCLLLEDIEKVCFSGIDQECYKLFCSLTIGTERNGLFPILFHMCYHIFPSIDLEKKETFCILSPKKKKCISCIFFFF